MCAFSNAIVAARKQEKSASSFHEEHRRETVIDIGVQDSGFDAGLLLGILIGEGHFGGDRKQPQVTLKMHVRHLPLLEWLRDRVPGARLYGPYAYERRNFYQLMIRGSALRERVIPLLDALPWKEIDTHTFERYSMMKRRYGIASSLDVEASGEDVARDRADR